MSALRVTLEDLVNRWAVGGNGVDAASCDLISACSAELLRVLDEHPADEGAPGNVPAKVIVVSEPNGRQVHYALPAFGELRNGELVIGRHLPDDSEADGQKIEVDVMYPPGQWTRVHKDGVEVPDATDRALRIARKALEEIARRAADGGEKSFGRPEIGGIARGALEGIFAETEL